MLYWGSTGTYRYKDKTLPAPFEFGDGISYTTFKVASSNSGSVVESRRSRSSRPGISSWGSFKVTVTNTGNIAASEAVLAFVRPISVPGAPLPLPLKQIVDFGRTPVLLGGGGSAVLSFTVSEADASMVDWRRVRAAHAGEYEVLLSTGSSNSAGAAVLRHTVTVASTVVIDTLPPPPPLNPISVARLVLCPNFLTVLNCKAWHNFYLIIHLIRTRVP